MTALDRERIPLSLYIHFPWCVKKCPYCDFNSHPLRGEVPEEAYVEALLRDLDFELLDAQTRPLVSIFMGGGTPSLFSGRAIARLLEAVNRRIAFASDIEITLEANPGTAEAGNFRDYRATGVNRLSIGVQSLDAAQLKRLGRIHSPQEAVTAVKLARSAGFDNLNLDLMFALPQQALEAAGGDLRALIALEPEHISYYQLTLEPNTEFFARPPPLPDDELAFTIQQQGQAWLADAGYGQYEVSAYARRDRQARHNLNYWQFGDYLGIGAGAHGKHSTSAGILRRARHKHPRTYMDRAGSAAAVPEERQVAESELPFEFCMNVLRLHEGFDWQIARERAGLDADTLARPLTQARILGLIEDDAGRVRPSPLGRRHLNRLLELFLA